MSKLIHVLAICLLCTTCRTHEEDNSNVNLNFVNGLPFPANFDTKDIEFGLKYEVRPDDLFITGYSKSGTTWTQTIVNLILHDGEFDMFTMHKVSPVLEGAGQETVENMPRPGAIMTHMPFNMKTWHPESKHIIVLRNPKDVCVSYYHHCKRLNFLVNVASVHDFVPHFLKGNVPYGSHFDFTLSWWNNRDKVKSVVFLYEDMLSDKRKAILDIAEFMGKRDRLLENNAEVLEKVLKKSDFDKMKGMMVSANMTSQADFFRKATNNDWMNHLTPSESNQIDELVQKKFQGTELLNMWEKYLSFD